MGEKSVIISQLILEAEALRAKLSQLEDENIILKGKLLKAEQEIIDLNRLGTDFN